ncbi:hypothetical protein OS493_029286, partial [Desmophyllum pertusum]
DVPYIDKSSQMTSGSRNHNREAEEAEILRNQKLQNRFDGTGACANCHLIHLLNTAECLKYCEE